MKSDNKKLAVNGDIRARQVRLIDQEGTQLGIVSIEEALKTAEQAGLDLVENTVSLEDRENFRVTFRHVEPALEKLGAKALEDRPRVRFHIKEKGEVGEGVRSQGLIERFQSRIEVRDFRAISPLAAFHRQLLDDDVDDRGHVRAVRKMGAVCELEHELVLARFQFDFGFRLALTEVNMFLVRRNDLTGRYGVAVDDQMMMARTGNKFAGRFYDETFDAEFDLKLLRDLLADLQVLEKDSGPRAGFALNGLFIGGLRRLRIRSLASERGNRNERNQREKRESFHRFRVSIH